MFDRSANLAGIARRVLSCQTRGRTTLVGRVCTARRRTGRSGSNRFPQDTRAAMPPSAAGSMPPLDIRLRWTPPLGRNSLRGHDLNARRVTKQTRNGPYQMGSRRIVPDQHRARIVQRYTETGSRSNRTGTNDQPDKSRSRDR